MMAGSHADSLTAPTRSRRCTTTTTTTTTTESRAVQQRCSVAPTRLPRPAPAALRSLDCPPGPGRRRVRRAVGGAAMLPALAPAAR